MAAADPPEATKHPHIANLEFREKELKEKLSRLKGMTDKEVGDPVHGFNRSEVIRRTEAQLAEVKAELKKGAK